MNFGGGVQLGEAHEGLAHRHLIVDVDLDDAPELLDTTVSGQCSCI